MEVSMHPVICKLAPRHCAIIFTHVPPRCRPPSTLLDRHPESARKAALDHWTAGLGLPSGFSFRGLMSTESQLLVWKGEGLPADDLSQASKKQKMPPRLFVLSDSVSQYTILRANFSMKTNNQRAQACVPSPRWRTP